MLQRVLTRGHLRSRWRRYLLLAGVLAVGLGSFFSMLMVLEGARDSLVAPLEATLTGPLRVTNQTGDLGAGKTWTDHRAFGARLAGFGATVVAPRFESSYITIRGDNLENWSAGLLAGVDPALDRRVADHSRYIVWGHVLDGDYAYAPDGHGYAPLVVGQKAAQRLNLSLNASGQPDFDHPLTITSGHTAGSTLIPVTLEAVVVGVFRTGLDPLDKFTAYVPIPHARFLSGFPENDPVANAFLVKGPNVEEIGARARAIPGIHAVTSEEFAFDYMGSMLLVLYIAGFLALALFLLGLLVWIAHETGAFIRRDQAVLCSLRAIGVPPGKIARSYVALTTGAMAAGAFVALLAALLVPLLVPPVRWNLSGLQAEIELTPSPWAMLLLAVGAVLAAWLTSTASARRVGRLNILTGLRRA